jgi:hypothetical protein
LALVPLPLQLSEQYDDEIVAVVVVSTFTFTKSGDGDDDDDAPFDVVVFDVAAATFEALLRVVLVAVSVAFPLLVAVVVCLAFEEVTFAGH